jgi:hypothetical protein
MRNAYKILIEKSEGKRKLLRARRRWKDSINIHLEETRCEGVNLIHVAQERDQWRALLTTLMNFRILFHGASYLRRESFFSVCLMVTCFWTNVCNGREQQEPKIPIAYFPPCTCVSTYSVHGGRLAEAFQLSAGNNWVGIQRPMLPNITVTPRLFGNSFDPVAGKTYS